MGPIVYNGGVAFRVWAPNATSVHVAGQFNGWSNSSRSLANEGNGNWSVDVPGAVVGQHYKYVINGNIWRNDPRAKQVVNSVGNGIIANLAFNWSQTDYQMPPWNELIIYEMHVGTFNDVPGGQPGTFSTAIQRLDHLKELGINMIQLMPINEFAGSFSWGYNPAYLFAPESAYGTPQQLKNFVNEAHKRGMGVMLDVVHNHYGPSDLDHMWCFDGACFGHGGIYFYEKTTPYWSTAWGDTRPNYGRLEVRSFIRDSVMYWLEEFRLDGVRWDSTSNIYDTDNGNGTFNPDGRDLLQWVNNEIKQASPWKISIAEDFSRGNWVTQPTSSGGLGFDSQWSGNFVHPVRDAIIQASDAGRDMWAVHDAITQKYNGNDLQRVIYTESHDEVANGQARVPSEIWNEEPGSYWSRKRSTLGAIITFTSPGIPMMFQGQEFLEEGWFQDTVPLDWTKTTTYSGILAFYSDLIRLRRNWHNTTAGLGGSNVNVFHVNNGSEANPHKVVAYHRWENGGLNDDVVVIANFSNTTFPVYNIGFPHAGTWHVQLNSDDEAYSPDYGGFGSTTTVEASAPGMNGLAASGTVSIGPYSAIILSRTPIPAEEEPTPEYWMVY